MKGYGTLYDGRRDQVSLASSRLNDGNKIAFFIIVDFGLVWKWRWCGTALRSIWGFVNALGLYLLHS